MQVTQQIADYIKKNKINLSALARETGLSYRKLEYSFYLADRKRLLRPDELVKVCRALKINPLDLNVD